MRKLLFLPIALASFTTISSAQTITHNFGSGANAFTMDFVTIGNPGNVADTTALPNPVGRVDYIYNLGKYEISRDQINKANAAGSLGITLQDMTILGGNGINRPATGISWNEAARFVNYLNTSKGYQAAYNFATGGANDNITLWGAGQYSGSNQYRHKDAYYFLPSLDEWYKGAYGSSGGTWYNYPTGSDSDPSVVSGGTSGAVFGQTYFQGPADVTNAGGFSPFGAMAMGGNVWEWIESAFDGSNNSAFETREIRGGAWNASTYVLDGRFRNDGNPTDEENSGQIGLYGFRVASVPEPSSLSLLALGGVMVVLSRRKR